MTPLIEVQQVSKRFRRDMTSFRDIVGYVLHASSHKNFWAVKDVSFKIASGESLGIIGPNGAGKSTLLKMLAQITKPTHGKITIRGRVGALIEVGAGFHPELTGRENIFLYGAILGMTKREIRERFEDIVEFSGLRDVLATPVKFYSTGMYLRLGFSVTIHMDPDILIIDEAMAVGDAVFQEKCFKKIEEFRSQGKIIIVVSHDLQLIERYASSCIVLDNGIVVKTGPSRECVRWYHEEIMGVRGNHTITFPEQSKPYCIQKISIAKGDCPSNTLQHGSDLNIETIIGNNTEHDTETVLGLGIFNEGHGVFGIEKKVTLVPGETSLTLHIPSLSLLKGTYTLRVGIWKSSIRELPIDYCDGALSFSVEASDATAPFGGVVLLAHTWI